MNEPPAHRFHHLHRRERAEAAALRPHKARPSPPALTPRVVAEVAGGGAAGAVARYLLTKAIPASATGFPWNTFTVNILGCLAMGLLTTYLLGGRPHPLARPFAVTGYLGGFTTFSHLIDGIYTLGDHGRPGLGIGYAAASVVVGWLAVAAGLVLGRRIPHRSEPA
ncbi:fluoride efflux transporter FluC [Actinomadura chibensis]|uniref:Fluoride-specific ion channel FluC n=1 Tax=Actinomadura chibensis TaxID=392828 RepID=A0A5D0NEY4_9ACTN|nr:CrcB family protein [Actinomadura chibensis]TYB42978.1 CrcB family protein [Actinomadura chibensis]